MIDKLEAEILERLEDYLDADTGDLRFTNLSLDDLWKAIRPALKSVSTIDSVYEFHKVFGHPIGVQPQIPDKDRVMLRLMLIFEELVELSEACGEKTRSLFSLLAKSFLENRVPADNPEPNVVAALDALLDLRYVLDGAVIEFGLHHKFLDGFRIVQESNMSKIVTNLDEARQTVKIYAAKGQEVKVVLTEYQGKIVGIVRRVSDDKIMKSLDWKAPDLEQLF
jgi:predicted HAD superfamily Cof-like phosphohydrolase